jgi:hypothetical protein
MPPVLLSLFALPLIAAFRRGPLTVCPTQDYAPLHGRGEERLDQG